MTIRVIKNFVNRIIHKFGYHVSKISNESALREVLLAHNNTLGALYFNTIKNNNEKNFLLYIKKEYDKSNSQIFQDLFALWITEKNHDKKYFVELGGGDGNYSSNTLLLENLGWNGLLIESSEKQYKKILQNRKCKALNKAVSYESNKNLMFYENQEDLNFSKLVNEGEYTYIVKSITLNEALKIANAPKLINYLSIDTEGNELDCLYGLDFNEYKFSCITIEHNYDIPKRKLIKKYLNQNGYEIIFENLTLYDDWYIKTDH